jgi:hypothetical protein
MNHKYINHCSITIGKFIAASNKCHEENHKKNQRIELLNQNNICYLKKGQVIVYRQRDDLVTFTLNAPLILGLAQMHNQMKYHYLRCESECEMYIINNHDATELFNKKNLWSYAFDILTWYINLYFQRDIMMINPNIRNVINEHIKYIWSLPTDVRAKTSVYSFITSRNHISRSAIHKVMQEMSDMGKIKIERGKVTYYNEI